MRQSAAIAQQNSRTAGQQGNSRNGNGNGNGNGHI
jgi:hypothetical protein